jgi:hypothetical protein
VRAANYGIVEDVHQSLMHVLAQYLRHHAMPPELIPGRRFWGVSPSMAGRRCTTHALSGQLLQQRAERGAIAVDSTGARTPLRIRQCQGHGRVRSPVRPPFPYFRASQVMSDRRGKPDLDYPSRANEGPAASIASPSPKRHSPCWNWSGPWR